MPALGREAAVLLDMAGCPNRCRHCWLGPAPNGRLTPEDLREVAAAFRQWRWPGESETHFRRLSFSSWFREPDFAPNYRELHALELALSDFNSSRFELLSIWRLARDPAYAQWVKELRIEACQVTFFGLEETTDWFVQRPGYFQEAMRAIERLLEVGIYPRWQVMLSRRFLPEAEAFAALAQSLRLDERVQSLGGEFALFLNSPSPNGEAFALEDIRCEAGDLDGLPPYLVEKTLRHFGGESLGDYLGSPEGELLADLWDEPRPVGELPDTLPSTLAFEVDAAWDVYTNLDEAAPWWRLGNLRRDGLDAVLQRYEADATPGLQALFHKPVAELAARHGRPESRCLYTTSDLLTRWLRLEAEADWRATSG